MSTGLIVVIVVVVLILIALAVMLPRMRRQAQVKARERELGQRRDRVATEHQQVASQHEREAEAAEQKARMAQTEAERRRSEAQLHEQKADMHQRGLADDELVDDNEREHFAPALERNDARRSDEGVTSTDREGGRAHEPTGSTAAGDERRSEYEQGRADERDAEGSGRFDRTAGDSSAETGRP
jgi:FtsZ-interacting cell division protein ZipA